MNFVRGSETRALIKVSVVDRLVEPGSVEAWQVRMDVVRTFDTRL